ncbi:MAG: hypothetical protein KY464_12640 [Gemmatimonadetes bacterium]|nr:hypothetical protein [Gemmatimonadota bacterium]
MSASDGVRRGRDEVERLLRESAFDLRTADPLSFRTWLESELPRWRRDPSFTGQERARELRRAHPALGSLEAEWRRAVAANEASLSYAEMEALGRELAGAARGIAWLTRAAAEAPPPGNDALTTKLRGFERRERELRERIASLLAESPERREALRLGAELSTVLEKTGVAAEEARLAELLAERGRRSTQVGRDFEEEALEATLRNVAGDLGEDPASLRILRGVKLGAAALELDQLLVRRGEPGQPVEVLAMVEVKSSPNDIGAGFRWTTSDRVVFVAVDIPDRYENGAELVNPLAEPISRTLPSR